MPKKKKKSISRIKGLYLALIVVLPVYAAFAVQFVPRPHNGEVDGGQGWPFMVCDTVNDAGDIGLLLLNASMIISGIYILVLLSAIWRREILNQAADGTPLKKRSKK